MCPLCAPDPHICFFSKELICLRGARHAPVTCSACHTLPRLHGHSHTKPTMSHCQHAKPIRTTTHHKSSFAPAAANASMKGPQWENKWRSIRFAKRMRMSLGGARWLGHDPKTCMSVHMLACVSAQPTAPPRNLLTFVLVCIGFYTNAC